jgi:hypothetical protein
MRSPLVQHIRMVHVLLAPPPSAHYQTSHTSTTTTSSSVTEQQQQAIIASDVCFPFQFVTEVGGCPVGEERCRGDVGTADGRCGLKKNSSSSLALHCAVVCEVPEFMISRMNALLEEVADDDAGGTHETMHLEGNTDCLKRLSAAGPPTLLRSNAMDLARQICSRLSSREGHLSCDARSHEATLQTDELQTDADACAERTMMSWLTKHKVPVGGGA